MFEQEKNEQQTKRVKKRSRFAYGVFGAITAAFLITGLFQWKGISVDINVGEPTAQADELNLGKDKEAVTQAIEKASDAVVGISNVKGNGDMAQKAGTGSGVIYKKDDGKAYVVTNHHVIQGADQLEVIMHDGEKVSASLKGSDPMTDLAVLQIDGKHVESVADLAEEDVEVGQTAIAIGNPLGMEFAGSATQGIISGLNRNIPIDINKDGQPDWQTEVIQTDAAINPGNSGGALVNMDGEVIGINSMKIAKEEVEGIGFSIPMNVAKPVIEDLETEGEVKRPYMGVSLKDVSQIPAEYLQQRLQLPADVQQGVIVGQVAPDSPAQEAGLQQYDVITEVDGEKVANLLELRHYLYDETKANEEVELTVYRNGEQTETTLKLAAK
ncbi:S1C family serine protease [Thalassobacillus hwangdonensis]|uniref:S1C family serine protease n=1 Tax=Thalassobacillus hwangdonensis TaxID=546108 RepID=A0ABW3L1W6_9BACI